MNITGNCTEALIILRYNRSHRIGCWPSGNRRLSKCNLPIVETALSVSSICNQRFNWLILASTKINYARVNRVRLLQSTKIKQPRNTEQTINSKSIKFRTPESFFSQLNISRSYYNVFKIFLSKFLIVKSNLI